MLELSQIKIPIEQDYEESLNNKIAHLLRLPKSEIKEYKIKRKSIDARKKPDLFFVFTIWISFDSKTEKFLLNKKIKNLKKVQNTNYKIATTTKRSLRPVVVGAGPSGLFSAYALALSGNPCLLIERGEAVEHRQKAVSNFFDTGILDPNSNVQFGEGGAGAFSDGKLNTQVHDKDGKNNFVLETFVKFGADSNILIDPKPHVGTDGIQKIIASMREELVRLGTEIRFHTTLTDLQVQNNQLVSITINENETLRCEELYLCIGHSARDTFHMLYENKLFMQSKPFAVGFRIEHPQEFIDESQYGRKRDFLPVSPYKLACNLPNGRGVYSFCMCPGGFVVNSSSEENRLCVNGMSYALRDSQNANSAIVISVGEKEFDLNDPMGAVQYQRSLEEKAYIIGKGKIPQQLYGDFVHNKCSSSYGKFSSVTKGKTEFSNLRNLLSEEINESFMSGMNYFNQRISGFAMEDAILSGIESRTSSPVRIPRDEYGEASIKGIYPCGEGAGYAGGITSAAMDGLRIVELAQKKRNA